jgi:WD40 repeat protein
VLVFDRDGQLRDTIEDNSVSGGLSAGLWLDSSSLLVTSNPGLAAGQRGDVGAIQRVQLGVEGLETVLWVNNLKPSVISNPARLARLPDNRLLLDTTALRQRLVEVTLDGQVAGPPRTLTSGMSRDRQPVYSRDGREVLFSSNRSGNLDLWAIDRETRALRQLTDHPSEDWDPGLSPDGNQLLWSSSRSGHLEIWMASADGSGSRQISHDGYDAENPTMTQDGEFIVYVSNNPATQGIWRMRADGSDAVRITANSGILPDVSPDGRWFLSSESTQTLVFVGSVETGEVLPFRINVLERNAGLTPGSVASLGRARWAPDSRGIYFIGPNENGDTGILYHPFDPAAGGAEELSTPVAGFQPGEQVESLGISPDGRFLTYSVAEESRQIMIAENLSL